MSTDSNERANASGRSRNSPFRGLILLTVIVALIAFHAQLLRAAYGLLVVDQPPDQFRYLVLDTPSPECFDGRGRTIESKCFQRILDRRNAPPAFRACWCSSLKACCRCRTTVGAWYFSRSLPGDRNGRENSSSDVPRARSANCERQCNVFGDQHFHNEPALSYRSRSIARQATSFTLPFATGSSRAFRPTFVVEVARRRKTCP